MFNSSKEIAELKEKLQTAEASVADLQGQLTAKDGELTAANTKGQELEGKVTEAQGRITALEAEKLKAEADLTQFKADFETKLNAAVIERCAAAGLETPVTQDLSASDDGITKPDAGKGLTGIAKSRALLAAKMESKSK